ncbi:hypothetical protein ABL78_4081 [Leptomonas seymouri]|uniref:Uncharacterized protein n=1 Tax=Leptomonas seymouri TaxID=5684 RepID=A0A0N1HYQ7_LEPSE|nr:hypothetical protein ABL78_4081 [Leptomonas seymouri]|eukprot:KPI86845.1 hypothetical protein ABL78_4081 [Leptomonas seymouri]
MAAVQRTSPSAENTRSDDIVLPASMQTLLDRYTERTLTQAERATLAKAAPNVRCEALRIFFQMNDAAAAVEYVLRSGSIPASSSQRHSGDSSCNTSNSTVMHSKSATKSTPQSPTASTTAALKAVLKPLSTNAASLSTYKPRADTKIITALSPAVLATDPSPCTDNMTESPAVTPMKQKTLRPPSLSVGGAGPNSGSRPRRMSAARRGESMCTLVTVSSMSDSDDDGDEELSRRDAEEERLLRDEDMPPTVTLRSQELRDTQAAAVMPQTLSQASDSVLKPNTEQANGSSKVLSPVVSAPAERPSRKSDTPTAATTVVAPVAPVSEETLTLLPSPRAQCIEAPAIAPPPSSPLAACGGAAPVQPQVGAAPHQYDLENHEEKARKTVAAKSTLAAAAVTVTTEPTAAANTCLPDPQRSAHDSNTQPNQQQHLVAFSDARAMAVLDSYRMHGAPPLGYRDEVELAYTELSCGHSSASPSCAAPSVASGGWDGVPRSTVDWAAMVASVRGPQIAAPAAAGAKPGTPPKERHSGTAAVTAAREALRTPRGSATTTAAQWKSTAEALETAVPSPRTRRTPRVSQEDVLKRKSGGSGHRNSSATRKQSTLQQQQLPVTPQRASRKKRMPGQSGAPATASPFYSSTHDPKELTSPEKQTQDRCASGSPLKRGVAWDDATGTYITHPNQRRRQLAAAAEAAAAIPRTSSTTVRAAGASALEVPDVLHTHFSHTASAAVVVAATADAEEGGVATTTPRMQLLTRTHTATGAATPSAGTTAAAVSFGRMCSSALHLSSNSVVNPLPLAKEAKKAKTPRAASALARTASMKNSAETLPTSSTNRFLQKRTTLTPRAPVVATPRPHTAIPTAAAAGAPATACAVRNTDYVPHRSGYGAPAAEAGFQRLRSGYQAMQSHDVYREGGEVISLQRQASQYHTATSLSLETLRRIASTVPAIRRAAGEHTCEIQPTGRVHCPSVIRSPRTARMPPKGGGMPTPSQDDAVAGVSSGWMSARGPRSYRSASGYHHPHQHPFSVQSTAYRNSKGSNRMSGTPATGAPCGVFERLTSNYYAVHSSAAALHTQPAAAPSVEFTSPSERHKFVNAAHSARRRHTSAPAGGLGRRSAKGNPYAATREGWLFSDANVTATRREKHYDVEEAPAQVGSAFTRSNTSHYLGLGK